MTSDPPPSPFDRFAAAPWQQVSDADLRAAQAVPTMITPQEQQLYFWLAAEYAQNRGAIVDLGAFVGGSTARLAAGQQRGGRGQAIHAFDRFTANAVAKSNHLYPAGISPFEGDDILPLARDLLTPWQDHITLHPGNLRDAEWTKGPIELLIVDSAKRPAILDIIAKQFYRHLIPGHSVVVHQDYLTHRQPWVVAQMEVLADCFDLLATVPNDSMVFLCTKVPTEDDLERAETDLLTDAELFDLLEAARQRHARFDLNARFDTLVAGLEANPRQRVAWKFKTPTSKG